MFTLKVCFIIAVVKFGAPELLIEEYLQICERQMGRVKPHSSLCLPIFLSFLTTLRDIRRKIGGEQGKSFRYDVLHCLILSESQFLQVM